MLERINILMGTNYLGPLKYFLDSLSEALDEESRVLVKINCFPVGIGAFTLCVHLGFWGKPWGSYVWPSLFEPMERGAWVAWDWGDMGRVFVGEPRPEPEEL